MVRTAESVEFRRGAAPANATLEFDSVGPCPFLADAPSDGLAALKPSVERIAAGDVLLDPRGTPTGAWILLDGWAARQKTLRDGRRQILGLILPNDVGSCRPQASASWAPEVRALTAGRVMRVDAEALAGLVRRSPVLAARLSDRAACDAAIMHAWLLNIGQRKAPERIAHLFCELAFRIGAAGLSRGGEPPTIPLTQQDLADALGMTSVHVNRVLQRLKAEAMIDIRKGAVTVLAADALARLCEFDPSYLTASRVCA